MSFLTGAGASLQIGKESTFGTGVSPTVLVDITSEGIKLSVEKGDEGSLLASKTPQSRDLLGISAGGSFSFILRPEFAGLLLHAALGGADTTAQVGSTDKYTHTLILCAANSDLPSLTLVVNRKAAVKKYPGCTISTLSLDCAAGDYVKGSVDIKGIKEETGTLNSELTGSPFLPTDAHRLPSRSEELHLTSQAPPSSWTTASRTPRRPMPRDSIRVSPSMAREV